jgi:hypothetical protein
MVNRDVSETALAFGAAEWASIVMSAEPAKHKWEVPVERRRWRGFVEALRSTLDHVAEDNNFHQARLAARTMNVRAGEFLANVPGYHAKVVDDLLDDEVYRGRFAEFLYFAQRSKSRPPQRGSGAALPARADIQDISGRCDRLISDIRANGSPLNLQIATSANEQRKNLFWFVFDPLFPADISHAFTGRLESETSFVVAREAPHWSADDVLAVLRQREQGLLRFARFVAGIPGSTLATVPESDRLDVESIMAATNAGLAKFGAQINELLNDK